MLSQILRIFGFGTTDGSVASAPNGVGNEHQTLEGNTGTHPHAAHGPSGHGIGNGNDMELDDEDEDEDDDMPNRRYNSNRRGRRARLPTFSREANDETYTDDFALFDAEILDRLCPNAANNDPISEDEESDDEISPKGKGKGKAKETEATGIRATDFGARPIRPLPRRSNNQASSSIRVLSDYPVPSVFPAHKKALQFEYIRFLYRQSIFDMPRVDFTSQDADRLYSLRHTSFRRATDTPLLAAMLADGAYRRYQRELSDPEESLPCWTIAQDAAPPTDQEIRNFIIKEEKRRYRNINRPGLGYPYHAAQRPEITSDFLHHRMIEHGYFGLQITHGVLDDQVHDMIFARDKTYISPGRFVTQRWMYHTGDSRPVMADDVRFYAYRHNELASERAPSTSAQPNEAGPSGLNSGNSRSSKASKGKKRAHKADPEEENDGHTRRTRARHSTTSETSTPGASSSSAPAPSTPISGSSAASSSRGQKRARDEEQDENSSPAKKAKATAVEDYEYDSDVYEVDAPRTPVGSPSRRSQNRRSSRTRTRTRARHSTSSATTTSTPGASSSSVPVPSSPTIDSSAASFSRGQKRARDEEQDEDSTPTKKAKATNDNGTTAEETTAPEAGPSGTIHVDAVAPATPVIDTVSETDAVAPATPVIDTVSETDAVAPATPVIDMVPETDAEINTEVDSNTDPIFSLAVELGLLHEDDVFPAMPQAAPIPVLRPLLRTYAFRAPRLPYTLTHVRYS